MSQEKKKETGSTLSNMPIDFAIGGLVIMGLGLGGGGFPMFLVGGALFGANMLPAIISDSKPIISEAINGMSLYDKFTYGASALLGGYAAKSVTPIERYTYDLKTVGVVFIATTALAKIGMDSLAGKVQDTFGLNQHHDEL